MSPQVNSEAEFAYGSGHVNPVRAVHPGPGFVYDAGKADYVRFLCGQGYNSTLLHTVTGDKSTCSPTNRGTVWDLNYPSLALSTFTFRLPTRVFKRTVTNVGSQKSTYKSYVAAPSELKITADPPVLSFSRIGQKLSFAVTNKGAINRSIVSASLAWDDGFHRVRSPIVVFLKA